ncbi:MAG: hypothetical protein JO247_09295 [Chloroflexi bacterium]|nr:hypothetical protein [Chloroflexota bacterium]
MNDQSKRTDHGPLDAKLKPERGPNRAAKAYPNPVAAQDLAKKSDSEQPRGSGGT